MYVSTSVLYCMSVSVYFSSFIRLFSGLAFGCVSHLCCCYFETKLSNGLSTAFRSLMLFPVVPVTCSEIIALLPLNSDQYYWTKLAQISVVIFLLMCIM